MTYSNWNERDRSLEEEMLAKYLATRVCERASGTLEDECVQNTPRDRYFIGNLRPVSPVVDSETPQYLRDLVDKLSPMAFGAEFRARSTNASIVSTVKISWNCYYRVFPSYEQQLAHQLQQSSNEPNSTDAIEEEASANDVQIEEANLEEPGEEGADIASFDDIDDAFTTPLPIPPVNTPTRRRRQSTPRDSLFVRFKKISCQAHGQVIIRYSDGNNVWEYDTADLQSALDAEVQRATAIAQADPSLIRTNGSVDDKVRVPETVLSTPDAFRDFCSSLRTQVLPQWQWSVQVDLREDVSEINSREVIVFYSFTNTSPLTPPLLDRAPNTESFFFDVQADFSFSSTEILPFELELIPRSFRYDRELWGRGFNCTVVRNGNKSDFHTTNIPIHIQQRYSTRSTPEAPFIELARNPLPVLEAILTSMKEDLATWDVQKLLYEQTIPNWTATYAAQFDNDRRLYTAEIERFLRGVELIRTNDNVRLAFQLTNETFKRGGRGQKTSWRLFQIVFLVTQIPGMEALSNPQSADAAERAVVDIVYFPTGGGKTEAYLGVIVFHCFFDRLRGKTAGVTAWTRFPLRLLTLQQTQRVADVIGIAELVRREQTDPRLKGPNINGFAVGYLAGQEATPNDLNPPQPGQIPDADWSKAQDSRSRQQWKKVVRCPSCGTNTVDVELDIERARILHVCKNPNCSFAKGMIPVFIVDNDIYRYLPSVVVGTIDKLAGVGNQRKFSLLLGQVDGRCAKHGYYKGICSQKGCKEPLQPSTPVGISGPTLFVQDELHLLKEGLGTFDSHYETFVQELLKLGGQTLPLKIIASSATIEAFERQVEHLYGRERQEARIFPGSGATLQQSFYAETRDYSQRLFVGIIPHNKTIFNAVLELIQYYHELIQDLQRLTQADENPYGGRVDPGTLEWRKLLDYYITSLSYFISTRDLNSLRTDLESAVNPEMQQAGYNPLDLDELTGGTSTDRVTSILEKLERPLPAPGSAPTTVLATNMVSHGVDVDRLNAMFFYGMPRQNAEYIQASSRVGRSHVGIVFNCLHPARERDQSHYAYFKKFHEFLGQLVEPVAINRWSKFSIQYTLPGLFMAVLLQRLANRTGVTKPNSYYMLDFVKREISAGRISETDFIPVLEAAYGVSGNDGIGPTVFREEIRLRVRQFLDQILYAGSSQSFVSGALKPFEPMRSLREVDEQIVIELNDTGTRWGQGKNS